MKRERVVKSSPTSVSATATVSGKLWSMLSAAQRKSAVALLLLMAFGMALETLGVGLVIPALAVFTHVSEVANYPVVGSLLVRLGGTDQQSLVIVGMISLAAIYAIKAVYLGFLAWRQTHFVFDLQADISHRLFDGYLRQPYTFHLERNSAQLIRNAMGQVADITNVIQQGLTLLTEALVLIGIASLLLFIEPAGAVVVATMLGFVGWLFYYVTRRHILRWGQARQLHEGMRIQHLQQGLGGVKDVKILGRQADFIARYQEHNLGSARAGQYQLTLQAMPRLWLEFLAICGLVALVLTLIGQGRPIESLVPTIGLFAAAAFRLMPSANRVLLAIQAMRFGLPVINTLYSELEELKPDASADNGTALKFEHRLSLDGVSFRYQSAEAPTLREITLSIPRGASVGFVGGSGAGKSTLVDVLLGLLAPDQGVVAVDGVDIQGRIRSWQDQIGYVPQSIFLTDDTLRNNVAFGLRDDQIDDGAVWRALRAAQLEDFVRGLPDGLATVVGERGVRLSGGQRQRIGIARALYRDPAVLVLDEATSSLDTLTEQGVMEAVRSLHGQKTIIIVAHRLSTVEHCDQLFRLEKGVIVQAGQATPVLGALNDRKTSTKP